MKTSPLNTTISFFGAAMDLCWLQALTAFVLYNIFNFQAPLLFVLFMYCCGIITNHLCYFRKRLRIQVLLAKVILFSASLMIAVHFILLHHNNNASPLRLSQLFSTHKPLLDWGLTLVILLLAGVVWRRSTIHVLKPLNQENVYHRLDLGIAVFFGLMVLKLMLFTRFDVTIRYPDLKYLFFPFFLFALLTIGLMFGAHKNNRQYAAGFQKIGVALSFAAVMLSGGLGMVFLFLNQMTASAETLSGILKKAGPPLEGAVVWVARLLWSRRRNHDLPSVSAQGEQNSYAGLTSGSVETGWLPGVLKWAVAILLILVVLFLIYLLGRYLLRFLLAGTDSKYVRNARGFHFPQWLKRFMALISRFPGRIFALFKGISSAADLFRKLVSWGRRSGIPYKKTDTPKEYGERLAASFPELKGDIEMIIHLMYKEIYGEFKLDKHQISAGKKAKKRMAHPLFWKNRIKTWVFSAGK